MLPLNASSSLPLNLQPTSLPDGHHPEPDNASRVAAPSSPRAVAGSSPKHATSVQGESALTRLVRYFSSASHQNAARGHGVEMTSLPGQATIVNVKPLSKFHEMCEREIMRLPISQQSPLRASLSKIPLDSMQQGARSEVTAILLSRNKIQIDALIHLHNNKIIDLNCVDYVNLSHIASAINEPSQHSKMANAIEVYCSCSLPDDFFNVDDAEAPIDLDLAEKASHSDIIKALKNAGCDINVNKKSGTSPLHASVSHPDGMSLAKILIGEGADPFAYDCKKTSFFDLALQLKKYDLLEDIITNLPLVLTDEHAIEVCKIGFQSGNEAIFQKMVTIYNDRVSTNETLHQILIDSVSRSVNFRLNAKSLVFLAEKDLAHLENVGDHEAITNHATLLNILLSSGVKKITEDNLKSLKQQLMKSGLESRQDPAVENQNLSLPSNGAENIVLNNLLKIFTVQGNEGNVQRMLGGEEFPGIQNPIFIKIVNPAKLFKTAYEKIGSNRSFNTLKPVLEHLKQNESFYVSEDGRHVLHTVQSINNQINNLNVDYSFALRIARNLSQGWVIGVNSVVAGASIIGQGVAQVFYNLRAKDLDAVKENIETIINENRDINCELLFSEYNKFHEKQYEDKYANWRQDPCYLRFIYESGCRSLIQCASYTCKDYDELKRYIWTHEWRSDSYGRSGLSPCQDINFINMQCQIPYPRQDPRFQWFGCYSGQGSTYHNAVRDAINRKSVVESEMAGSGIVLGITPYLIGAAGAWIIAAGTTRYVLEKSASNYKRKLIEHLQDA